MKRLLIILMICLIFLCSCSDKNEGTVIVDEQYNLETDMQYYYRTCNGNYMQAITASNKGYYYSGTDGKVFYIDRDSQKAAPLCDKVNCDHTNKNECNAFLIKDNNFGPNGIYLGNAMQYYEGKLYYIDNRYDDMKMEGKYYLAKCDPDGRNIEKVTDNLKRQEGASDWYLHRGYLYFVTSKTIYRLPLSNTEQEPEILFELGEGYDEYVNNIENHSKIYDDGLYFTYTPSGIQNTEGDDDMKQYWRKINLDTKEITKLVFDGKSVEPVTFVNNRMYFEVLEEEKREWKIYVSDLDLSNVQEIGEHNTGTLFYTDGNYIYLDMEASISLSGAPNPDVYKDQTITIYDMKMENEIDSFKLPSIVQVPRASMQDKNCFIFNITGKGEDAVSKLYYLDKSKIGTFNGDYPEMTELCEVKK